jgi:hypothetical protein
LANTLLTTSYIVNRGLLVLENTCVFSSHVQRQYSDEFAVKEAKIGATVNIRRPPRYFGTYGPALNVEDTNETYIPVSLNYQFHVDVQFTTVDLLLEMDLFETRVLKPMMATVGNRIDSDGLFFAYQNTAQFQGTPGVGLTAFKSFSDSKAIMKYEAAPKGEMPVVIVDPLTSSSMADSLKGLFNPQKTLSSQYEQGAVAAMTAGFDWYEDENVATWTTGAQGGTPVLAGGTSVAGGTALLASGWAQTGTFETSGWTGSTGVITVGDVLQINGVYPVNPQNRSQYGRTLKQFVVIPPGGYAQVVGAAIAGGPQFAAATLANGTFNATTGVYTSTSGGLLTIYVKECLIYGGQFQNCSAAPVSPYTVTVNGGTANAGKVSSQCIAMYKNAFALAFADLPLPRGVAMAAARANDDEAGISIRMVTQYTINNDAEPTRADVLYGWSGLYTQQAVRAGG